jgi:predicted nucleic acid-binding protein
MTSSTLASEFVTDTMALVLRLEGRKLGKAAKAAFESMENGNTTILVPGLVFAEVLYLSEKSRITVGITDVSQYMSQYPTCKQYPLDLAVVQAALLISDIRELHDRVIAGTAHHLRLVLITNDPVIQASSAVRTVW